MILDLLPELLVDCAHCHVLSHHTTIRPLMSEKSNKGQLGKEQRQQISL